MYTNTYKLTRGEITGQSLVSLPDIVMRAILVRPIHMSAPKPSRADKNSTHLTNPRIMGEQRADQF
jgi:hypothetical protein